MEKLGIAWIPGYKPAHHFQDALVEAVQQQLVQHPEIFEHPAMAAPPPTPLSQSIFVDPPELIAKEPSADVPALRQLIR